MKTVLNRMRNTIWLPLAAALSSVACGVEGPAGTDDSVAQEFNAISVAACGSESVGDDHDEDGNLSPPFISPQTYNTCGQAYVVDLDEVVASPDATVTLEVKWGNSPPVTQSGCLSTTGRAVLYRRGGGQWHAQTGLLQTAGTWSAGQCKPPAFSLGTLDEGATYRVAASMLAGQETRRISFSTLEHFIR
jgi:hypothetical protein